MGRIVVLLALALAASARAQDLPKPTEAGQKALDKLIGDCVAAGGLRSHRGLLGLGPARLSVGAAAKLKAAVAAEKDVLTPELRDALVARWGDADEDGQVVVLALLRAAGDAGDALSPAYAAYFSAMRSLRGGSRHPPSRSRTPPADSRRPGSRSGRRDASTWPGWRIPRRPRIPWP